MKCDANGEVVPIDADAMDLISAEVRHDLDKGLVNINLHRVREALVRSWLIGYLGEDGIAAVANSWAESQSESQLGSQSNPRKRSRGAKSTNTSADKDSDS